MSVSSAEPDNAHEELCALLERQRSALVSRGEQTFQEWQRKAVIPYLRDCLAFYDRYAQSAQRWDAIVLAHQVVIRYHSNRHLLAQGIGRGQFPNSPEILGLRACSIAVPTPQTDYEAAGQVRTAMMADEVLNSPELARVLVVADWALESGDCDPVVYAMLASGRAERQREMDSPNTREMRRNRMPASAFAGRLAQAGSWLRNVEKRFPGETILTTPSRHGRWSAASAHRECAKSYFACLAQTASESEYVAELRRYRRGPIAGTAVLACDKLKACKMDRLEEKDASAPLEAGDVGLSTAAAGSPEAIYLEFLNEERQSDGKLAAMRNQQGFASAPLESADRQTCFFDGIERALSYSDRLSPHPLRWRVIARGFGVACRLQTALARPDEDNNDPYLQSVEFQRMVALGLAALKVEDLDPGVYAVLLMYRLDILALALREAREHEAAHTPGHAQRIEVLLAEAFELYQGISRRWPTLFEFKDQGDSLDWYADKSLRMATERYLSILEQAGRMHELKSESERIARGPPVGGAGRTQRQTPSGVSCAALTAVLDATMSPFNVLRRLDVLRLGTQSRFR